MKAIDREFILATLDDDLVEWLDKGVSIDLILQVQHNRAIYSAGCNN